MTRVKLAKEVEDRWKERGADLGQIVLQWILSGKKLPRFAGQLSEYLNSSGSAIGNCVGR